MSARGHWIFAKVRNLTGWVLKANLRMKSKSPPIRSFSVIHKQKEKEPSPVKIKTQLEKEIEKPKLKVNKRPISLRKQYLQNK